MVRISYETNKSTLQLSSTPWSAFLLEAIVFRVLEFCQFQFWKNAKAISPASKSFVCEQMW